MGTENTTKNIIILLTCLLGIALIVFNIYQHKQIKEANQIISLETSNEPNATSDNTKGNNPAFPQKSSPKRSFAPEERQSIVNKTEELAYHLEAAEEELEMINEQISEHEAKKAEKRKLQRELQKRYREDPSYKKSMRRSLDIQYADLFEKLDLAPEKLDIFKDLLVEEMLAQQDIYLDYDDTSSLSEEEREELNRRYMEVHEEYETKYGDFLSEDNYETYQAYTETQSERYNVNNFIETLGSGERLTESQKEDLIEAMNEELKNVTWERLDEESESSSNMYSEKNIELRLANYNLRIEAYSNAADSILSAAQLEKFNTYLQKEYDQFKLYMEMAALRYGSTSSQESNNGE